MIRNGSYYCKGFITMIDNRQALDMIEQAQTDSPFCACGRQTLAVGRGGGVWLECSSLQARPRSLVQRLLAEVGVHTRVLIVDLTPTPPAAQAAQGEGLVRA
jgi:hypothetical protein